MAVAIEKKRVVKFASKCEASFYDVVKQRVEEYFEKNNISKNANGPMRIKTAAMLLFYFGAYVALLAFGTSSLVLFYVLWLVMGLGIVGIGTCIMHDSNHGSYSQNKVVNSLLGNILNVLGGYAPNWRIQHNILHHTYTNLHGFDEDIAGTPLIRMCPHQPRWKVHKYQHIYAWAFYSIMNLFWVTAKDYKLIFRYHKNDLLRKEKLTLGKAITELTLLKIFYVAYILVLPIMLFDIPWYHTVLGFVAMHMVAGLALACIFQPAHVMESSEFPMPTEDLRVENSWAIHQLLNTTNFAPGSKFTSWFIGGLNYQIEHHLFPQICHVHYPRLSKIVQQVAESYGLPYNVQPTVIKALAEHGKMLRTLGRQ